jgi:hypothetical protein
MDEFIIPSRPSISFTGGANDMPYSHSSVEVSSEDNWVARTRGLRIDSPLLMQPTNDILPLHIGHPTQELEENIVGLLAS